MAIAYCMQSSFLLRLLPVAILLLTAAPAGTDGLEAHLHFFMHDIVTGPDATAVEVVNRTGPVLKGVTAHFGDIVIMDDVLTEDASPASRVVGRAQGFYMFASMDEPALLLSMNVVLTAGPYKGSTVSITGRDDILAPVRELSVVGGTGWFRMARGYVLWKTASLHGKNAVLELDAFVHA